MQVRCLPNILHWISTFFYIYIQTLNLALHQPALSLPCASLQSHLRPSPPFLLHSLSQAPKLHSYRGHHCHCTLWSWATGWPWVGPATLNFRVLKGWLLSSHSAANTLSTWLILRHPLGFTWSVTSSRKFAHPQTESSCLLLPPMVQLLFSFKYFKIFIKQLGQ